LSKQNPTTRGDYPHHLDIPTRWADNDQYGHVNNVAFYGFFDTVVNDWLIKSGVLDPATSSVIGLVVETGCQFYAPLSFPETLMAGLRAVHIGRTSAGYKIAIFGEGRDSAAAEGHFVHVYVDRATRQPVQLPDNLRAALQLIKAP
jgi:acyl-CoA thioester hydrolase